MDVTRRTLNILKKGLSMMRSFVRRPDSCLSAPSSSSCFYIRMIRVPLCSFSFSCPVLSIPLSLITMAIIILYCFSLSLFLSFSSLQYRKEIKIVCVCVSSSSLYSRRRRRKTRRVVRFQSSFIFLVCRLVLLSFRKRKKIPTHIHKKNIEHQDHMMAHG